MEEIEKKTRSTTDYLKSYARFCAGLVLTSFGIALTTKMKLGTSPISAIPYSLSLIMPSVSMGSFTVIFSALLVALQLMILKKRANYFELALQLVISFPFGYLIDASVWLLGGFEPKMYAA